MDQKSKTATPPHPGYYNLIHKNQRKSTISHANSGAKSKNIYERFQTPKQIPHATDLVEFEQLVIAALQAEEKAGNVKFGIPGRLSTVSVINPHRIKKFDLEKVRRELLVQKLE